jgi:hypothetical protein
MNKQKHKYNRKVKIVNAVITADRFAAETIHAPKVLKAQ